LFTTTPVFACCRQFLIRERARGSIYLNAATLVWEAKAADRPGRSRKRVGCRENTRTEKAAVRVAGRSRSLLAERYVLPGAPRCWGRDDLAVFGHERRAQNRLCVACCCKACADFPPVYRFPRVHGTLATPAAMSGSVPPAAVAIRLPVEQPGAEAAAGRWPSGHLHRGLMLRFRTTELSRPQRRLNGAASSPELWVWGWRRMKRKH
jgi:hypothetical protein